MPDSTHPIVNFGGNIRFTPRHLYTPRTEADVLAILDHHALGKVRVMGALHSWNAAMASPDALIDLRHFNRLDVQHDADGVAWATVGGGCRIKHLLQKLHRRTRHSIPTMGLITEQTIAGAISTATHGSGRHSLSHYMDEIRVAAFDPESGKARIYNWKTGDELRAARCALGCLGIILSVCFRCIPQFDVAETIVPIANLEDVLNDEAAFPLQQFYLIPHAWSFFVQRRVVVPVRRRWRFGRAFLYRAYWPFGIDIGLHLLIKLLAAVLQRPKLTRAFFRRVFPKLILTNTTVIDRAERMLVMHHELFKHLEIELFVPARHLRAAAEYIRCVLDVLAGSTSELPDELAASVNAIGMADELHHLRGSFTHHYPIAFRRVLPDDAMISPCSGSDEAYYAISFITYVEPRDRFLDMACFLAHSTAQLFQARLHWGKYFPLVEAEVERLYPRLPEFRTLCERIDPNGVFRSEFMERILFQHRPSTP